MVCHHNVCAEVVADASGKRQQAISKIIAVDLRSIKNITNVLENGFSNSKCPPNVRAGNELETGTEVSVVSL